MVLQPRQNWHGYNRWNPLLEPVRTFIVRWHKTPDRTVDRTTSTLSFFPGMKPKNRLIKKGMPMLLARADEVIE